MMVPINKAPTVKGSLKLTFERLKNLPSAPELINSKSSKSGFCQMPRVAWAPVDPAPRTIKAVTKIDFIMSKDIMLLLDVCQKAATIIEKQSWRKWWYQNHTTGFATAIQWERPSVWFLSSYSKSWLETIYLFYFTQVTDTDDYASNLLIGKALFDWVTFFGGAKSKSELLVGVGASPRVSRFSFERLLFDWKKYHQ